MYIGMNLNAPSPEMLAFVVMSGGLATNFSAEVPRKSSRTCLSSGLTVKDSAPPESVLTTPDPT